MKRKPSRPKPNTETVNPTPETTKPYVATQASDLTRLTSEEVFALSAEDREAWNRQSRQNEADYALLVAFFDELYPICRKVYKAQRNATYYGIHKSKYQDYWDCLFDLLLSLPTYAEDDPEWLTRVTLYIQTIKAKRRQHRKIKTLMP